MKYFGIFFAVFFAILVTMPCNDGLAQTAVNKTELHKDHKDSSEKHTDTCSPFCSCSCCGMQISEASYSFYHFEQEVFPIYLEIVSYQPQKEFGIIYGIWQPPKI